MTLKYIKNISYLFCIAHNTHVLSATMYAIDTDGKKLIFKVENT